MKFSISRIDREPMVITLKLSMKSQYTQTEDPESTLESQKADIRIEVYSGNK